MKKLIYLFLILLPLNIIGSEYYWNNEVGPGSEYYWNNEVGPSIITSYPLPLNISIAISKSIGIF